MSISSVNPYSNSMFYFDVLKKTPSEQVKLMDNYNNSYATSLKVVLDYINKALRERTELIFAQFVPPQRVIYYSSRLFMRYVLLISNKTNF